MFLFYDLTLYKFLTFKLVLLHYLMSVMLPIEKLWNLLALFTRELVIILHDLY